MKANWKSKLDLLKHKMNMTVALEGHIDAITARTKIAEKIEQKPAIEQSLASRRIIREKAIISAISKIPSYKTGEYYQLSLISQKTKNLELQRDTATGVSGLIHFNTLKLAKRRLIQILNGVMKDIGRAEK